MFVPGALQMSREGHADTSKKETNCPVLINSSYPSVTFHCTLLPEHEKQTQRTGKKCSAVPKQFSQSAHMLSGEQRLPLPTRRNWECHQKGSHKVTDVARERGHLSVGRDSGFWTCTVEKNTLHNGPEERIKWVLTLSTESGEDVSCKWVIDLDSSIKTENKQKKKVTVWGHTDRAWKIDE